MLIRLLGYVSGVLSQCVHKNVWLVVTFNYNTSASFHISPSLAFPLLPFKLLNSYSSKSVVK